MKKLSLLFLVMLTVITVHAQNVPDLIRTTPAPASGGNKNNRATVDANLKAALSLNIPRAAAFSLNGAKDSVGYVMFNTTSNRFGVYRGGGVWDTYVSQADMNIIANNVVYKTGQTSQNIAGDIQITGNLELGMVSNTTENTINFLGIGYGSSNNKIRLVTPMFINSGNLYINTAGTQVQNKFELFHTPSTFFDVMRYGDMSSYSLDANVVHKTGDENISGMKSWNSQQDFNAGVSFNQGYTVAANQQANFISGSKINFHYPLGYIQGDWQISLDNGNLKFSKIGFVTDASTTEDDVNFYLKSDGAYRGTNKLLEATDSGLLSGFLVSYVPDISDLIAYSGTSTVMTVTNQARGSKFVYSATGTPDGGTCFPRVAGGYWQRLLTANEAYPEWWGTSSTVSRPYLQKVLDYVAGKDIAAVIRPGNYLIDSTMIMSSNSTLDIRSGAIIKLKDNTNRPMLMNRNAVKAGSAALLDSNMHIMGGGKLDGNGPNQTLYSGAVGTTLTVILNFHNFKNTSFTGVTLYNSRSFATFFTAWRNIYFKDIDIKFSNTIYNQNHDGLHAEGPGDGMFVNDLTVRGTDDQVVIAANAPANEYRNGLGNDVYNVVVNGLKLDSTHKGNRLLAGNNNLFGIVFSNIVGGTKGNLFDIGNYGLGTAGKIYLTVYGVDIKSFQTVDQSRALVRCQAGQVGDMSFENIKINGSHFRNPILLINRNFSANSIRITNNLTNSQDSLSTSIISAPVGLGGFINIKDLEIDGFKAYSTVRKTAVKLIDINKATIGNLNIRNCFIDSAANSLNLATDTIGTFTSTNNLSRYNSGGSVITNSKIDTVRLVGTQFTQNGTGLALIIDASSTIGSIKADLRVSNNAGVSALNPQLISINGVVSKLDGGISTGFIQNQTAVAQLGAGINTAGSITSTGNYTTSGNILYTNNRSASSFRIWPTVAASTAASVGGTILQSNINETSDTDGGPAVELFPDVGTGANNGGKVRILAYGRGTGQNSNVIQFTLRSGVNAATDKVRITPTGTGFGVTTPSALIHTAAGTSAVGGSPFKFTLTGAALQTVKEPGTFQPNSAGDLFYVKSSGLEYQLLNTIEVQTVNNKIHAPGNTYQTALGTAGTDSLVVKNGGALRAIPANFYQISQSPISVSSTSQAMAVNRVYIVHNTGTTTMLLPPVAAEGDLVTIIGECGGVGTFNVTQNAGQYQRSVSGSTTTGTGGYLQGTSPDNTITLRCTIANTKWTISTMQGTFNRF